MAESRPFIRETIRGTLFPLLEHFLPLLAVLFGFHLAQGPALADNAVYSKVAPSTVWFYERGTASGVLIDVEKKLIATAEHVVRSSLREGKTNVKVIFAQPDKQGGVLVEKAFYGHEMKGKFGIDGTVVYSDRLRDLAFVKLSRLPAEVRAIPLASKGPRPGDRVHVVGNSTHFKGGLFSYSTGHVRNSYHFEEFDVGNIFYSLAHHAPTNRGDSGGPVANDKGELIGIISQGTVGGAGDQVIDHSVHLEAIRRALEPSALPMVKELSWTASANMTTSIGRIFIPVRKGNTVQLAVDGNGSTDLDLYAEDIDANQKNRVVVSEQGTSDQERANFTPRWTGVMQVKVLNRFAPNDPRRGQLFTPMNTYTLKINCNTPLSGPIYIARPLAAGSTDQFKVYFNASNAKARLTLRGDGDTKLILSVNSPDGKDGWTAQGAHDQKQLAFPVATAGHYTIQIRNPEKRQFNAYTLMID